MRRALLLLGLLAPVQAGAVCTLDPGNINTNITLSNGNKTFTSTNGSNGTGSATVGYLGGAGSTNASYKLYFEMTANTVAGSIGIGVDRFGDDVALALGDSFAGAGLYATTGHVHTNGTTGATYFTFTSGAIIGVAVDFFHQKLWWTNNGTTWDNDIIGNQNPATNTGGFGSFGAPGPFGNPGSGYTTVVPAFGTEVSSGNIGTFNGGDTSFTYTAPAGFAAWCGATLNSTPQLFQMTP